MNKIIHILIALTILFPVISRAQEHLYQFGPNASAYGDCGACVIAMMANARGGNYTCDDIHYGVFGQGDIPVIGMYEMALRGRSVVNVTPVHSLTAHSVTGYLARGVLVAVYVDQRFTGAAHMILVTGFNSGGFVVNDPAYPMPRVLSYAELDAILQASGGWGWLG